ncbi:hypothetical protein [Mycobacterium sp.]|uniref:hypothetical protein n=1 Tax=Mycobacterium sp. TaxID=1785 RepID=UPI0031D1BFF7
MKAKREAPPRRGGDRRRRDDDPARTTGRRPADSGPARRARPGAGKASAPAREPRPSRSAPQTAPIPRPAQRLAPPKNASQAKARAKARKAKAPKVVRPPLRERLLQSLASIDLRPRTLAAKVPFVVLVIGSLGAGLGLTLWLSTDSAERSYQLGSARERNQLLQQRKEALERDVLEAQAAPALAEAARGLGMIPSRDTAHLIQDPGGTWVVVGAPKPAEGVPPPPLNTKLPDEKPAPPANPATNPVEVPVRVSPDPGAPGVPRRGGPQVMIRTPDGAATLGTQRLPGPGVPPVPVLPQTPSGAPTPIVGPLLPGALNQAVPQTIPAPPVGAGVTPPMAGTPIVGEQFGPLTATSPGGPR